MCVKLTTKSSRKLPVWNVRNVENLENDIQVNPTPKNLGLGGYKDEDGKSIQVLSF